MCGACVWCPPFVRAMCGACVCTGGHQSVGQCNGHLGGCRHGVEEGGALVGGIKPANTVHAFGWFVTLTVRVTLARLPHSYFSASAFVLSTITCTVLVALTYIA